MVALPAVGILGGTFDPVHTGHIQCARELQQRLGLQRLSLMPCHLPPHREAPRSSAAHRLEMVRMATRDVDGLGVDDRELSRAGPSYTADTLAELRAELGEETSLNFVMGSDAYNTLHTWVRWQSLFEFANVIVMSREGYSVAPEPEVAAFTGSRQIAPGEITNTRAGGMAVIELTPWPQSATAVRERLAAGHSLRGWVPDSVATYIDKHHLYIEPEKSDNT